MSATANAHVDDVPMKAMTTYSAGTPPTRPRMLTIGRPIANNTARCGKRPRTLSITISPPESWLAIR